MRSGLESWWRHLVALVVGTGRTWWGTLPLMITSLTLAYLVNRALLVLSAYISAGHPWLSMVTLSTGFAATLVGYLFCFHAIGARLGVRRQLAEMGEGEAHQEHSLTGLVAVTLFPFLAIYAVFGKVQELSGQMVTYEVITRGIMERGVLTTVNPRTLHQSLVVLGVLAGAYIVRRVLDAWHERSGIRVVGILTALVETFFMLVLIYGGTRVIVQTKLWLHDRAVVYWWDLFVGRVAEALAGLNVHLPGWIASAWQWAIGPVWSWASEGLIQPMLWLALAGLAFGSRVMSMSELVRETVGQHPTRIRVPAESSGFARAWGEVKELFFGDLDDKYAPTIQSVRLVFSAGLTLIGAFCLLHCLAFVLDWGVNRIAELVVGPAESRLWVSLRMPLDLLQLVVAEPFRLALLGVTYLRCLQVLTAKAQGGAAEGMPAGAQPNSAAQPTVDIQAVPGVFAGHSTSTAVRASVATVRSHWPQASLALVCVVLAGWVLRTIDSQPMHHEVPGRIGDELRFSTTNQTLQVLDVTGTTQLQTSGGSTSLQSQGNFVALGLVVRTPGERTVNSLNCRLHQGEDVVKPIVSTPLLTPGPGFQQGYELAFERPTAGVDGASLHCTPIDPIRSYSPELVIDLASGEGERAYEQSEPPVGLEEHQPEVIR